MEGLKKRMVSSGIPEVPATLNRVQCHMLAFTVDVPRILSSRLLLLTVGMLARSRGKWMRFSNFATLSRLKDSGLLDKDLRRAVYVSCLDASFGRTGACLGIVRADQKAEFVTNGPVSEEDILPNPKKVKALIASQLVGRRRFQALPRLVRRQLLSLDGALILTDQGEILAVGPF